MDNVNMEDIMTKAGILAESVVQVEIVTTRGKGKFTYIWAKVGVQWYCYQNVYARHETDIWVRVPHYDETTIEGAFALMRSIYDDWAETPIRDYR